MDDVIWRQVEGSEHYLVSNTGLVKRAQCGSQGTPLKPMMVGAKGNKYPAVCLCAGPVQKVVKVHVLVLKTFVCDRPPGAIACHIDGDRTNNNVNNLYWGSWADNARDRVRHNKHANQRLTNAQTLEIRARRDAGERGVDLAAEFGVSQQMVWNIYARRVGGYLK